MLRPTIQILANEGLTITGDVAGLAFFQLFLHLAQIVRVQPGEGAGAADPGESSLRARGDGAADVARIDDPARRDGNEDLVDRDRGELEPKSKAIPIFGQRQPLTEVGQPSLEGGSSSLKPCVVFRSPGALAGTPGR